MTIRPNRTGSARALLLAACVALGAWLPSPAAGAQTPGSITGRVTDANGQPIGPASGICALLGSASGAWSNLDANGSYRIDNVSPGQWAVRFVHCQQPTAPWPRYAPEYYPNLHSPGASASPNLPNITVPAGQTVTGIDAQLELASTIRVTVRDTDGTPREGICVTASYRGTSARRSNVGALPESFYAQTDATGVATLTGVTPGDFYFQGRICPTDSPFTHPDLTRWQYSGGVFDAPEATTTPVALSATVDAEVVMQPGASVTGRLTHGGEAVAGTCVQWDSMNPLAVQRGNFTTTTDSNGYYELRGLPPTVPAVVGTCIPAWNSPVAQLWLPYASSRWTADILKLAPGEARTWDAELPLRPTVAAIVTSLPSPTGCRLRIDDVNGRRYEDLRPAATPGVFNADSFGFDRNSVVTQLECGGRVVGKAKAADELTPGFQPGGTENEYQPVVEVVADLTGPTITPSRFPTGWSRLPFQVSFTCSDQIAGVASCPAPVTFSEGQQRTVTAKDKYGNTTSRTFGPLMVDQTAPKITVASPRRTFKLNETISLGCAVSDARSGLRSKTVACPSNGTPASRLGTGEHSFTVGGTDNAGNSAYTTVRITIVK